MIKIVDGNLLAGKEDIKGHQVNALGEMNTGVAGLIRGQHEEAFIGYKELCQQFDEPSKLLGICQLVECSDGEIIANLFGQALYGYDGERYTDVPSLKEALMSLKNYAKENGLTVALPYRIGSCRGGADWSEVYSKIEEVFKDYYVTLYKLDLG